MASVFTKIIKGELPSHKVYEDDKAIAILDIHPARDGHVMVIPKKEVDHFDDLDQETYVHLMLIVKKIAKRIKKVLHPERVGVLVYGFDVPHVHVHLIPLYDGKELSLDRDADKEPDHDKLAETAKSLRINGQ